MIQLKSMLTCIDNSGATLVECALKLKLPHRHAKIGDRIVVVVQRTRAAGEVGPGNTGPTLNKVKRGEVKRAVIVRCAKEVQRKNGMVVRFDDNACALIGKNGEPLGTRMTGVVGADLRGAQWSKILTLAGAHV